MKQYPAHSLLNKSQKFGELAKLTWFEDDEGWLDGICFHFDKRNKFELGKLDSEYKKREFTFSTKNQVAIIVLWFTQGGLYLTGISFLNKKKKELVNCGLVKTKDPSGKIDF